MVTSIYVVLYSLQGAFTFIISFDPQFLKLKNIKGQGGWG